MLSERSHFRVEYPVKARPVIQVRKQEFAIINISESGILFVLPKEFGAVTVGHRIRGTITFKDAETIPIEGEVLRHKDETVAMRLSLGISLKRIMLEQRWLLTEYGTLKQAEAPD